MKRRTFLQGAATLAAGAALAPMVVRRAEAAGPLRLLTWEGYAEDAWVKDFEQANGATVTKTYVGSNDEYMAKLAAGGGEYDLVVIVSALAQRAINAGFVEALDRDAIPNLKQLYTRLQDPGFATKDGKLYGAPTFLAISPVTVNAEAIPTGSDFGVLFDKANAGKIAMWDDVSTLGDTANWMGIDNIWTMSDEQLAAVKAKLIEQKPMVRTYWSQAGEAIDLFMNKEIVASNSWSYITTTLQSRGLKVRDFPGKPPIGAIDSHFIVKGSANRALALNFIDHVLGAKAQGAIAELTGYTPTNPQSRQFMKPETWQKLRLDDVQGTIDKMKFWEDIPRRAKYLEVLNEVKAA
ncbi:MAG: extracellular solute-binding protein [Dongiaceae bacterium]